MKHASTFSRIPQRTEKRLLGPKDTVVIMVIVAISFGIFLIPDVLNWLNARAHAGAISGWVEQVRDVTANEIAEILEAAEAYNERLRQGEEGLSNEWEDESYRGQLNIPGSRVMGRVVIPTIDVALPIFHGTSDAILELGAGHMYGTSLPVGGEYTHSVVTAHSGIDGNTLFNGLHDLRIDDIFMVEVAGRQMFYKIDEISIVDYDIRKAFVSESGNDYLTLLTCTPIGINSHRLLVRGIRFDPPVEEQETIIQYVPLGEEFPWWLIKWLSGVATSGIIMALISLPQKKRNRKELLASDGYWLLQEISKPRGRSS